MSRILQIRRGTTVQNKNFTGLPGELSFDTENKTLRVHDGATLGGFELARRDQITDGDGGSGFDINSVPSEFWESVIATYAPTPVHIAESNLTSIGNVGYIESVFNLPGNAKFAQAVMVCQTPEAGYNIGDAVAGFGIGARANPLPNTFSDENGIHARLFVNGENFWVSNKTTGAQTNITNAKWKLRFIVWY